MIYFRVNGDCPRGKFRVMATFNVETMTSLNCVSKSTHLTSKYHAFALKRLLFIYVGRIFWSS